MLYRNKIIQHKESIEYSSHNSLTFNRFRLVLYTSLCLLLVIPETSIAQGIEVVKWDLKTMISHAIAHNISVKQTKFDAQVAGNNYTQSKANRLPTLGLSGSQSLTHGTSIDPITSVFVSQTVQSTSVGLSANWNLYSGGQVNQRIQQNQLLLEQSDWYQKEAENSIVLSITQSYLEALYYKEGVLIAEENLTSSDKQLENSQALFESGSIAAKDLAEIKSQYANDQYTLVTSRNALEQQVLSLKQMLELEPQQSFELYFPQFEEEVGIKVLDKFTVYERALEAMPEIQSSILQRDIISLDVKIAKASYQPTLSLFGGLSTGYTNTQDFSFTDQFDNNYNQRVGLTLSIPIFRQLSTKTNVQNAQLFMQSAELDALQIKKELYAKIENAHQSAIAAQSEMGAVKKKVEAAKVSYDLAQQQFDLGLLNSTDLIVNRNVLLVAQLQYVQTKYLAILYYQLLRLYQGDPIQFDSMYEK